MDAAPSAGAFAESPLARVRARAAAEPFLAAMLALLLVAAVIAAPLSLVDDSWMTLLAGREIARSGLPHAETLTTIAHGRAWVDQQWLAQVLAYGAYTLLGLRGALVGGVLVIVVALGIGMVAARRAGGSAPAVGLAALAVVVVVPWLFLLRAQTLALPLFVALFALLAADARRPSPNVLVSLPLLALWANLHGSVALAALLVVVRALGRVARARGLSRAENLRTAALLLGAPAAVLCTPYGLAVVPYYHRILASHDFGQYVNEWRPPTLDVLTAGFFLLAGLVAVRAGRHPGRLTRFEQLALVLLAVMALDAKRNIVWFALAALVTLPRLIAEGGPATSRPRDRRVYGALAAVAVLVSVGIAAAGPLEPGPVRLGDAVAAAAARDPSLRIFPAAPVGDWLIWQHPELAGRIAWDARIELLRPREIGELASLVHDGAPNRLARGYRLFVFDSTISPGARRNLRALHARLLAHEGTLDAYLLPRA